MDVQVLVLVDEGVGSAQQPRSNVQPVTVLVPQKEGMRDKNSLVLCEQPHLLQVDVPNYLALGYSATAGDRFEMGFLHSLASVQRHPEQGAFQPGLAT